MARTKFIVQNFELILMLDGSLSPEVRLTYFLLSQMLESFKGSLRLPKRRIRYSLGPGGEIRTKF